MRRWQARCLILRRSISCRYSHGLLGCWLFSHDSGIVERLVSCLFILLDKVAASAAPCLETVGGKVTIQIVLRSDVVTLNQQRQPVAAEIRREPESNTRGIERIIIPEGWILPETVMSLAKGHARSAPGNEAGINRIEAAEEILVPLSSTLRGRCSQNVWLRNYLLDTTYPLANIIGLRGGLSHLFGV